MSELEQFRAEIAQLMAEMCDDYRAMVRGIVSPISATNWVREHIVEEHWSECGQEIADLIAQCSDDERGMISEKFLGDDPLAGLYRVALQHGATTVLLFVSGWRSA